MEPFRGNICDGWLRSSNLRFLDDGGFASGGSGMEDDDDIATA